MSNAAVHNALQLKFDLRCSRVKAISFHPTLPWVVCGLHSGTVEILDYRIKSTVDRFEEHEGAVRGASFHPSQPLFVTGGDDAKIKIWNYKLRRCLFTLTGHMDYIRATEFHREQPWVLSASDDQTVRIWNWQSRSCLSTLTGHNHYVMSAQFHPTEDLIVTSSLDLTIRVWDISGLRNRRQEASGVSLPHDLFGSSDIVVKFILEGHTKAVNYAAFHPTKPMIVSSSDDRTVRLWKVEDTRTYEFEQLCGHMNNVSSALFFKDAVVSCGEDRTIRVWDTAARATTHLNRRDNDRFWMLAVHEQSNLIAAGHDNGLLIFKLDRERPAWTIHNNTLFWIRDRSLRSYAFASGQEISLTSMRRLSMPPVALSCNPADNSVIASYDIDGGVIECFSIQASYMSRSEDVRKMFYTSAVFYSPNKWAALDKTGQLLLRNTQQEQGDGVAKVLPPIHGSNRLFPAWSGHILCRSPTAVYIFQVTQKSTVAELAIADVKYVVWDADGQKVALLSKHAIVVATRKLKLITIIHEPSASIKSAAFDAEREVLFFTTLNHLKYCTLRNGDTGIIQSLQCCVYLVRASGNILWWISREGKVERKEIANPELAFKLALQQERYRDILAMIQSRKLMGSALVAYLQKNNHPDIAMHFSRDPWIRFNLALQSGTVDVAKSTAQEMNRPDAWCALAEKAIVFGDIQLAQLANAKIHNDSGLCYQLLLTGATGSMRQVAQQSGNLSLKVHTSIITGDPVGQVAALVEGGHLPLAYATAMSHGLVDLAQEVRDSMDPAIAQKCASIPAQPQSEPPAVDVAGDNWPLLPVQESMFQRLLREPGLLDMEVDKTDVTNAAWGDDNELDFVDDDDGEGATAAAVPAPAGDWEDDLEIDIPISSSTKAEPVVPREGEPISRPWAQQTDIVAYHIAAGSFQTALDLLQRQIALADRAPLQGVFMQCWCACNVSMPSWGPLPAHASVVAMPPAGVDVDLRYVPRLPDNLPMLMERVRQGYQAVTEARFADARKIFHGVLMTVVVTVAKDRKQYNELMDIVAVAREYVSALNVEVARKDVSDAKRAVELAVYFAHFKLQSSHLVLALSQAMTQAFKAKCIKTSAIIARRLMELDPGPERLERARKVVQVAEQQNSDALALAYDDRNPFTLCVVSKSPMYRGTVETIRCVYCHAVAHPKYRGTKCPVCLISILGGEGTGILCGISS